MDKRIAVEQFLNVPLGEERGFSFRPGRRSLGVRILRGLGVTFAVLLGLAIVGGSIAPVDVAGHAVERAPAGPAPTQATLMEAAPTVTPARASSPTVPAADTVPAAVSAPSASAAAQARPQSP
ncbi:MAG: hypothetical protein WCK28_08045 [Burkholderiales bacterium]